MDLIYDLTGVNVDVKVEVLHCCVGLFRGCLSYRFRIAGTVEYCQWVVWRSRALKGPAAENRDSRT